MQVRAAGTYPAAVRDTKRHDCPAAKIIAFQKDADDPRRLSVPDGGIKSDNLSKTLVF